MTSIRFVQLDILIEKSAKRNKKKTNLQTCANKGLFQHTQYQIWRMYLKQMKYYMNLFSLRFNSCINQIVLRAPTLHKSPEEKLLFHLSFANTPAYFQRAPLLTAAELTL